MGEIPYRWRTGSPSDTDALSIQGDSLTLSYPCSSDPESDQDSLHVHGYPPPSAGSQFDSFLDHFEDTPYVPPRHLQLLSLQLYPSTAQSVSYGTTLQSKNLSPSDHSIDSSTSSDCPVVPQHYRSCTHPILPATLEHPRQAYHQPYSSQHNPYATHGSPPNNALGAHSHIDISSPLDPSAPSFAPSPALRATSPTNPETQEQQQLYGSSPHLREMVLPSRLDAYTSAGPPISQDQNRTQPSFLREQPQLGPTFCDSSTSRPERLISSPSQRWSQVCGDDPYGYVEPPPPSSMAMPMSTPASREQTSTSAHRQQSPEIDPAEYLRQQLNLPPDDPVNLWSVPDSLNGEKPKYSYPILVKLAIHGSPEKQLTLKEIYAALEERFAWFRNQKDSKAWKGSIRHNLSLNKVFCHSPRPLTDPGKGSYWHLNFSGGEGNKRPRKRKALGKGPDGHPLAKSTTTKDAPLHDSPLSSTSALTPVLTPAPSLSPAQSAASCPNPTGLSDIDTVQIDPVLVAQSCDGGKASVKRHMHTFHPYGRSTYVDAHARRQQEFVASRAESVTTMTTARSHHIEPAPRIGHMPLGPEATPSSSYGLAGPSSIPIHMASPMSSERLESYYPPHQDRSSSKEYNHYQNRSRDLDRTHQDETYTQHWFQDSDGSLSLERD